VRFTDLPLDRPVATLMLLLCLTVLGTVAVAYLPLGFMPVVEEPEIDIEVPFPGSHPLEGLRQVVRPIEEEVATIPDVKMIWGFVSPGNAEVEVQFDWGVNIDLKKMEVREAVERVRSSLPQGIGHIRVQGDTDGPGADILGGRISAERDLSESWDLLDRRIRRPLERIRGVARVHLYGVEPQEVRVDLDLAAIKRHNIGVGELIQRINAANLDMDLGAVRGDVLRYDVRTRTRFTDVETIRELIVGAGGVRLRDVAETTLREPILDYGRHLNRNFAIGFDVYKEPTANTIETVDRLLARIEEVRRDPELHGINVLVWMNQGEEIRQSLAGLRNAGLFGGLLAIGVLFFFLRRLSTTLIVAVAIPFSLLVTCGAMFLIGLEFNVLTLLGLMLGVGMLVDNAVVVIENIYRLQGKGVDPVQAARQGSRQVALAVVAATATTIIVWSWLFISEPDQMRIYIGEVALVICLSVTCSLLISLTFIPLAAARFVPRRQLRPGIFQRRLIPGYRRLLAWTLRHRVATLCCLLLLAGSAAIPIVFIEKSGQPRIQRRDVSIHYRVHDDSTKEVVEQHVNIVEDWIESRRDELGYDNLYSWYGAPGNAVTRVYLPRERATEAAMKRLREQLQEKLPVIPGVELELGDQRRRHRGPREGMFVRIALRGEDPEYLQDLASEVEERVRGLPHVKEIYGPSLVGSSEVRVMIDPARARALGVSPQRVADTVGFAFRGQHLRRYQGERGEIEMIMGLPETAQPGLAALIDLPIPTEDDELITLGAVAEVELARIPSNIQRVDRRTTAWVVLEFNEDEITTAEAKELVSERLEGLVLPEGYLWDWGQEMHREDEALRVMLRGILLSLLVVLLLMAALFESFTQPLAIIVTLPLALFGAFWALWLFGFVFEILGFIGVIILVGLVVNNGIVMVDHVNLLRREGKSREQALVEGCGDRLRPVLMTAITTIFGLTPLAFSEFTVAGVFVQSMAVAMIGGLASSTIFTLLALPVWYAAVEDVGKVVAGLFPSSLAGRRLRFPASGVLVDSEQGRSG